MLKSHLWGLILLSQIAIFWFFCNFVVNSRGKTITTSVVIEEKQIPTRLLYMTASYTLKQYIFLWKSLESIRDICEFGWDVEVHIQAANNISNIHQLFHQLKSSLYCHRIGGFIPLKIEEFGKIGFGLNSRHRNVILSRVHDFDYFAYAEEDMLFTLHNLQAYLQELHHLQRKLPHIWMDYAIGFLRFEERNLSLSRVTWEYLRQDNHFVDWLDRKYLITNNLNQVIILSLESHNIIVIIHMIIIIMIIIIVINDVHYIYVL
jgi:hypothetical protein